MTMHVGRYIVRSLKEREAIAEMCLKGSNQHRERFAKEIIIGDLFDAEGYPRHYWHCTATLPPYDLPGRRGQWKATPGDYGEPADWVWQDWGPAR